MEPGCAKNSSSVARHLLLSDEQRFNPEMPSCSLRNSVAVKPEGNPDVKTQYGEVCAV
ncbi:hypothetical protein OESDEN_21513 [Oesophagostomum dentatum]|nr:hypothetical protein OESDEN_21513 [Oesophagostomum dentatum]